MVDQDIARAEPSQLVTVAAVQQAELGARHDLDQVSMAARRAGSRRYLYQNIYGNTHPPEGVLVLDRDVRCGHRLRSVELTTSPVRLIRVLRQEVPWETQAQGFHKMARTLTSLASRSNSQMVESGWISSQTGALRQINSEAAERVFRDDNAAHLERFKDLRRAFKRRELEGDEVFRKLLAPLPEKLRIVVVLRDQVGLNYKEMSQVLGCSRGAVEQRMHRAMVTLREIWHEAEEPTTLTKET